MNFEHFIAHLYKLDALDFLYRYHYLVKVFFTCAENLNISYLCCLINADNRNIAHMSIRRADGPHK